MAGFGEEAHNGAWMTSRGRCVQTLALLDATHPCSGRVLMEQAPRVYVAWSSAIPGSDACPRAEGSVKPALQEAAGGKKTPGCAVIKVYTVLSSLGLPGRGRGATSMAPLAHGDSGAASR